MTTRTAGMTAGAMGWERVHPAVRAAGLALAGCLFVALCARLGTLPLPFTPIPLTLANFGVLLVGLVLGSRLGAAAMALYLAQGSLGLPVFTPAGPGGIAQLLGPTGGYLLAYPAVAFLAGWIAERDRGRFSLAALGATAGEIVLFAAGISWLVVGWGASPAQAVALGIYPFLFAEVMKVMTVAGIASRLDVRRWLRL